jgi:hypothetical protein
VESDPQTQISSVGTLRRNRCQFPSSIKHCSSTERRSTTYQNYYTNHGTNRGMLAHHCPAQKIRVTPVTHTQAAGRGPSFSSKCRAQTLPLQLHGPVEGLHAVNHIYFSSGDGPPYLKKKQRAIEQSNLPGSPYNKSPCKMRGVFTS